jgi:hypothetical protein
MKRPGPLHVVVTRPDAPADAHVQLAAASELFRAFADEIGLEHPVAEVWASMAVHVAHEVLWTERGGAAAKWEDFPVEEYFLRRLPATSCFPPDMADAYVAITCAFFVWLGDTGRVTREQSKDLLGRAKACWGGFVDAMRNVYGRAAVN